MKIGSVKVPPLTGYFHVGLVKPPTLANWSFVYPESSGQNRQHLCRPAANHDMIHEYTAPLHHFFHVAEAQRLGDIPARTNEHHLERTVHPLENLTKCSVDQTLSEIKHGADCGFGLLQNNESFPQQSGKRSMSTVGETFL